MNPSALPPSLEFYLFGAPDLRQAGIACPQPLATKARALLYYLALTNRSHTRAALAGLLWGDLPEQAARANLRKMVQALAPFVPYLAVDRHSLGFAPETRIWVDARAFEEVLGALVTQGPTAVTPAQMTQALALYRGDLLEGFYVQHAPDFETWHLAERTRLHTLLIQGLSALGGQCAEQGDLRQAIAYAQQLLRGAPWHEETHRQLMAWYAQSGQRSIALAQYELCRRALMEELAVEPGQATQDLYQQLLHQELPVPGAPPSPRGERLVSTDYPLIGRVAEWQTLRTAWRTVLQNGAHLVMIGGEAGLGKTRLAGEILHEAQRQGHAAAYARAYALEGSPPYGPVADWLRTVSFGPVLDRLPTPWLTELARLLPELLVKHPELSVPLPVMDVTQQKRLLDALVQAVLALQRPLLLVMDDLQWCDAETLEWLLYLLSSMRQAKVLVVGTVRREGLAQEHPLRKLERMLLHAGQFTEIKLEPLTAEATAELGAAVAEQPLEPVTAAWLHRTAGGNPFVAIETLRAGTLSVGTPDTQSGPPQLPAGALPTLPQLPPKVYALVQARLAQVTQAAQPLVQVAATIGRAFSPELLTVASRQDEEAVLAGLDELWRQRIIQAVDAQHYDFSHDRLREVAYAELSPMQRRLLHGRVADALALRYAGRLDIVAGELAVHYERAARWIEASDSYHRAATVARALYAHNEVVDALQKALAVLHHLSDPAVRATREIDLLHELGLSQFLARGSEAAAATAEAWRQARDLALIAGTRFQQARAVHVFQGVLHYQGRSYEALVLNEQALALAEGIDDPYLWMNLLSGHGEILLNLGRTAQALPYYERTLALFQQPVPRSFEWLATNTPAESLTRMAQCLWLLGYPDKARARCAEAMALQNGQTSFLQRVNVTGVAAELAYCLRDVEQLHALGEEMTSLSAQHNYADSGRQGRLWVAWARAQHGRRVDDDSAVESDIAEFRHRSHGVVQPLWCSVIAEILAAAGNMADALKAVEETLMQVEELGNRFWSAHLLRLRGALLQRLAAPATEVEASYQQALALAQEQQAKTLELRAATALARLWQRQGRGEEAYSLLRQRYDWFKEGFDTPDLVEAKALLDDLLLIRQ